MYLNSQAKVSDGDGGFWRWCSLHSQKLVGQLTWRGILLVYEFDEFWLWSQSQRFPTATEDFDGDVHSIYYLLFNLQHFHFPPSPKVRIFNSQSISCGFVLCVKLFYVFCLMFTIDFLWFCGYRWFFFVYKYKSSKFSQLY